MTKLGSLWNRSLALGIGKLLLLALVIVAVGVSSASAVDWSGLGASETTGGATFTRWDYFGTAYDNWVGGSLPFDGLEPVTFSGSFASGTNINVVSAGGATTMRTVTGVTIGANNAAADMSFVQDPTTAGATLALTSGANWDNTAATRWTHFQTGTTLKLGGNNTFLTNGVGGNGFAMEPGSNLVINGAGVLFDAFYNDIWLRGNTTDNGFGFTIRSQWDNWNTKHLLDGNNNITGTILLQDVRSLEWGAPSATSSSVFGTGTLKSTIDEMWYRYAGPGGGTITAANKWDLSTNRDDWVHTFQQMYGGKDNTNIRMTGEIMFPAGTGGNQDRYMAFRSDSINARYTLAGTVSGIGNFRPHGVILAAESAAATGGKDIHISTWNGGAEHVTRFYFNPTDASTLASNLFIEGQWDGGNSYGSNTIGTELTTGTVTFGGTLQYNDGTGGNPSNVNLYAAGSSTALFNGVIGGGGRGNDWGITKTGSGTVQLAGANTFARNAYVAGGTLQLVGSGTLGNNPQQIGVWGGGTLDVTLAPTMNLGAGSRLVMSATGTGMTGTLLADLTTSGTTVDFGLARGDTGVLTVGNAGMGSWTMSAGTVMNVDAGTTTDRLIVAKAAALNLGGGTVNVYNNGLTVPTGFTTAQYPLISYNGGLAGGSVSNLALGVVPDGIGRPSLVDTGTSIDLLINESLQWVGVAAGTGAWNNSLANTSWRGNSSTTLNLPFHAKDAVILGDFGAKTGFAPVVVNVTDNVNPTSVAFTNTSVKPMYLIQGSGGITSDFNVKKTGSGTVIFANTGTNVWPTTEIREGAIQVGGTNALAPAAPVILGYAGTSGLLDLSDGGTLDTGAYNQTIGGLSSVGTGGTNRVINSYNALTAPATSVLTINNTGTHTFGGTIGDPGLPGSAAINLVKNGAGTQVFSGDNVAAGWTGQTVTISGGKLVAKTLTALGSPAGNTIHLNGGSLGLAVEGLSGKLNMLAYNDQAGNAGDQGKMADYTTFTGWFNPLTPNFTGLTNAAGKATLAWPTTDGETYGAEGYHRTDQYVMRMNGYVYLPGAGTYNFHTTSDDGSKLWVDTSKVGTSWVQAVSNLGWQGMTERGGDPVVVTAAGWYPIDLAQYEGGGGSGLIVRWDQGTGAFVDVPQSMVALGDASAPTAYGWNIDVTANPVDPNAPSGFDFGNAQTANMGTLAIGGQTLQLTGSGGSKLRFTGAATFSATPTFNVASGIVLDMPTIVDNGHGFNASGAGKVYMSTAAANSIGGVMKAAGGTIEIDPAGMTAHNTLAGSGSGRFTGGPINLNGVRTFNVDAGGTLGVANQLTGTVGDSIVKTGLGTLVVTNATNSYGGGTQVNAGTFAMRSAGSAGSGTITLNAGGALGLEGFQPGLSQGWLANQDYNAANPGNRGVVMQAFAGELQKGQPWPDQTGGSGAQWGDNETWCYSGKMYLPNGTVSFAGDIDDDMRVKIDGNWIGGAGWQYGTNIVTLGASADGWHDVEFRFHNGTGGAGATSTRNGFVASSRGFIYNPVGNNNNLANNPGDVIPADPGDGSLFRVPGNLTISNNVVVAGDSAITNSSLIGTMAGTLSIGANTLTVNGSNTVRQTGATTFTGRPTFNIATGTGVTEIAGTLNDGGFGLSKDGPGKLALSNAALTMLGGVNMLQGTLDTTNVQLTAGVTAPNANVSVMTGSLNLAGSRTFDVAAGGELLLRSTVTAGTGTNAIVKTGLGKLSANAANLYTGGTQVNAGIFSVQGATAAGSGAITLNTGGTLNLVGSTPGLNGGRLDGNAFDQATAPNFASPPFVAATVGVYLGPDAANVAGNTNPTGTLPTQWVDNSTWVYTGQIYLPGGNTTFVKQFDDNGLLKIDGVQIINNTAWDSVTTDTRSYTAGWHDFELRYGQGGGGVGPNNGWTIGFGVDTLGRGSTSQANYVYPTGGSWFRIPGNITIANNIVVAGDSALDSEAVTATVTGTMSIGSQMLTVTGGTTVIQGVTTFSGTPTFDVRPGATLDLQNINAGANGLSARGGGTLYLSNAATNITGVIDLSGNGNIQLPASGLTLHNNVTASGTGNNIVGGPLAMNPSRTFTVAAGGDLTVGSQLTGQVLTKAGPGTLKLTNTSNNVVPGAGAATVINDGAVLAAGPGTITVGTSVAVNNGGTLALTGASSGGANINGFVGGWTQNGSATIAGNVATLTPASNGLAGSVFTSGAIPTASLDGSFHAKFTYQPTFTPDNQADGFTFVLQNNARGATAVGDTGGALGYSNGANDGTGNAITNSAGLAVNIYGGNANGRGITSALGGIISPYMAVGGIDFNSTTPIDFDVAYNGVDITMVLKQGASTSAPVTYTIGTLSGLVSGGQAYVGFTGGTGGLNAKQDITNFSFTSAPIIDTAMYGNAVTISGSGSIKVLSDRPAGFAADATLGNLTMTSGATLNVGAFDGSTANAPYQVTVGATALNGGTATFNVDKNGTGAGRLVLGALSDASGTASVVKTGTGTLVLSASNTNAGTLTVSGGKVAVNGFSGTGAVTVQSGGAIGGTGTINGTVTVNAGGTFQPGDGSANITTVNSGLAVTLSANSLLSFDLDSPGVAAGTGGNSLISVYGTLNTGSGITLDVIPGMSWAEGVYHLITYGTAGTISTTGWSVTGTGIGSHNYAFSNTGSGIDLTVSAYTGPTVATWASNVDGPWSTAGNWSPATSPNSQGATANFKGNTPAALTVDVDGAKTVGKLVFDQSAGTTNYSIGGATHSALTMDNTGGAGNASIAATAGSHAITSQVVTSAASNLDVSVATGGALSLSGGISNTLGKAVTLTQAGAGALSVGNIANDGAGVVNVAGGTVGAGNISGTGATSVAPGASLTATSIVQNSLTIGAGGSVTIAASAPGAGAASAVPEPGTILLTLIGGLCLGGWLWRRRGA